MELQKVQKENFDNQNNINKNESEINLPKKQGNNNIRRMTMFRSSELNMLQKENPSSPSSKIINDQILNMNDSSANKENNNNYSMNKPKDINIKLSKTSKKEINNVRRHIRITFAKPMNNDGNDYLNINISLHKKRTENKSHSLQKLKDSNDDLFIENFSNFLENKKIEIDPNNKSPKFNKDNEYLSFNDDFWIKYINYISMKYKSSLTISNFANFIDQFYRCISKNENNDINYDNFKDEIINNITKLFDFEIIDNFLEKYGLKGINDLFNKFKQINNQNNREIKINNEIPKNKFSESKNNINMNNYKSNINFDNMNISNIDNMSMNNIDNMIMKNMDNINKNNMNYKQINNMANMNINNMDNNINFISPMKIMNYENSYANAALQALTSLDCMRNWINALKDNNNFIQNFQSSITYKFFILFSDFYNGNQVDSTNLILTLQNQVRKIYNNYMKKDEYHFLYYFLNILHLENNCPNNPEFDIKSYNNKTIKNAKNNNNILNSFSEFFQQTKNSIISHYFYNIEKYFTSCSKCREIFYYDHKIIITFKLDELLSFRNQKYPNKIGSNINIIDCFNYYQNEKYCQCPVCKDPMSIEKTTIFSSTKVLILRFKRSSHNLKCDVDFENEFTINNINDIIYNNNKVDKKYILKSVISLNKSMNSYIYCSDVNINDKWYRYYHNNNDNAKNINNNELKDYEPQILIYELKEDMNQNNNYNNNINLMTNLINNQKKMLNSNNFKKIVDNNFRLNEQNSLNLNFIIVPENYIGDEKYSIKKTIEVTLAETMEKVINKFFIKFGIPREAIKRFAFNHEVIDVNSKNKLRDFDIENDSEIYAVKADNYDMGFLFNNNNNNNNNNIMNNNVYSINNNIININNNIY